MPPANFGKHTDILLVAATLMTNAVALNPDRPGAPVRGCKDCAICTLVKRNAPMVTGRLKGEQGFYEWHKAV